MKYTGINFFLPSYHRVSGLERFIDSCESLAEFPANNRYTILANHRDEETISYACALVKKSRRFALLYESSEEPNLAEFYNTIYRDTPFRDDGLLVSMLSDDREFTTRGFDSRILAAVNDRDGSAVAYCNDAYVQQGKLCVDVFTTRKVVEATGKPFMCPAFKAMYIDTVWMIVGEKTGLLRYLGDVILEHHHEERKPGPERDETYLRLQKVGLPFAVGYREVARAVEPIVDNLRKSGIL